jgi:hypothetical protein
MTYSSESPTLGLGLWMALPFFPPRTTQIPTIYDSRLSILTFNQLVIIRPLSVTIMNSS